MTIQHTKTYQWRFVFRVLLPVLIGVVATFGIVAGLVYLSAQKSDEQAFIREIKLVSNALDQQKTILRQQHADAVGWDDALSAVSVPFDFEWIEENLGENLFESHGHDLSFILDPELNPVFAMKDGSVVSNQQYAQYEATFRPFVYRLRELDWQGALAAYSNDVSQVLPSVGDILNLYDQPAIVNFMPIASDSEEFSYRPGSEFIHISVQWLDATLASQVARALLLTGAHFSKPAEITPTELSVPIFNQFGQKIAQFSWTPARPAAHILSESTPAVLVAFSVILLIIGSLMYGLRRSTAQIERSREQAQYMAFHDKLTGLPNRALFEDRLSVAMASARRGPHRIALHMIDLDRFKQVNDSLGHGAGDELIQQVAKRLMPILRATDTIARLGGDEFAVIQTDVSTILDVDVVAKNIIKAIGEPFNVASSQAFVGASIGIALAPDTATNTAELTRKADIALYEAKAAGRNTFKLFENEMGASVEHRQNIETELRDALVSGKGLDIKFQPIVQNVDDSITCIQADINWHHPEFGELTSDKFISVAESCGLIEKIGEFVLKKSCLLGAQTPDLRISVKTYAAQLRNPLFFDTVFRILNETDLPAERLELEITESMLSESEPAAAAALKKLRHAGINIALGDFGVGFNSLRHLQKIQVDRIKIDRLFIEQLADSPDPEAITHAVVWLARAMGVEVSADGVDNIQQKNFLARMGCTSFQGDLFTSKGMAESLNQHVKPLTLDKSIDDIATLKEQIS